MSRWDNLLGQEAAKELLRASLRAERPAHGRLFEGPAGVGKRTAGLLFLQTLMCRRPPQPDEPCGECRSCRRFAPLWRSGGTTAVEAVDHPDLIPLAKFDVRKNPTGDTVKDYEELLPLATIHYVSEQLNRPPSFGRKRAVLLPEAQRLCAGRAEAANAFLKTLEEPPRDSIIVMTSSRPEALLETVVSRVQKVRFRRLSRVLIEDGLRRRGLSAEEAREFAALADGSLGRALALREGDHSRWRTEVFSALSELLAARSTAACPRFGLRLWAFAEAEGARLFAEVKETETAARATRRGGKRRAERRCIGDQVLSGETASAATEQEAAKTESGWKRRVFSRLLELTAAAFREALAAAVGGEETLLQPDRTSETRRLAEKFGEEGCLRVLAGLEEALRAVRLYVRGDLVARVVAGRLAEVAAGNGSRMSMRAG